jgi:hypothetical protein
MKLRLKWEKEMVSIDKRNIQKVCTITIQPLTDEKIEENKNWC